MAINAKPFFIKVITPLHAGSGSDLGVVDLPIQREAHTAFPKIEGSSLKGAIRSDFADRNGEEKAEAIFGTGDKAGDLGFSDARILFFPVKSVRGVFAYVTCPMALERYAKDIGSEALALTKELSFPKSLRDSECFVLGDKNIIENKEKTKKTVILEEYSFEVSTKSSEVKTSLPEKIYNEIKERLVIISDDNFKHFVQNSTEIITRIKINNDTGTVQQGGLFTEEFLPAESVMYALAIGDAASFTTNTPITLQIGGDANLGKGIMEITIGVKVEADK